MQAPSDTRIHVIVEHMRLLIITQKVDQNDDILGFMHGWIAEFAKHCEQVIVICLYEGEHNLPDNVRVFSLGKEKGASKWKYFINFYRYIWSERKNYDAVFVHMNQEYVLMGATFWFVTGKNIFMWRNHHAGSFLTDIAVAFCSKVFCTSKYSYTAQFKKTVLMPVGIDIEVFKPHLEISKTKNILFLARISPVKKPHVLIAALALLRERGTELSASFFGDPLPKDILYYDALKKTVADRHFEGVIQFEKGIPNTETVRVYNAHDIFVNLSSSGMYDKTIFEAMACGTLVLASNKNLIGEIDDMFIFEEDNVEELAQKLEHLINLSAEEKNAWALKLRDYVKQKHSLRELRKKLFPLRT